MTSEIFWLMVCNVGLTELIKTFFPVIKGKWAACVSIVIGIMLALFYVFFNKYWEMIRVGIVSISGSVIFYDTVYKTFKELVHGNKRALPGDSDSIQESEQ